MGWDVKKGGRKYYYQSQRVDGKTVKIYKGPGKKGADAERQDQERRLETKLHQIERASAPTAELGQLATALFKAILIIGGHYLHNGHEWRRRKSND
jgi:hypothetical protein